MVASEDPSIAIYMESQGRAQQCTLPLALAWKLRIKVARWDLESQTSDPIPNKTIWTFTVDRIAYTDDGGRTSMGSNCSQSGS